MFILIQEIRSGPQNTIETLAMIRQRTHSLHYWNIILHIFRTVNLHIESPVFTPNQHRHKSYSET